MQVALNAGWRGVGAWVSLLAAAVVPMHAAGMAVDHVASLPVSASRLAVSQATGQVAQADQSSKPAFVTALQQGHRQRIVVYGTSLTAGGDWVNQFRQALDERFPGQAAVVNRGQGGQHSRWGLANVDERVIAEKPDVVFIEFAINDATDRFGISVKEARDNLQQMIERIRQAKSDTEIILQVMNPATDRPKGHAGYRGHLPAYEQMVRDTAKRLDLRLVDHAPAWQRLLAQGDQAWKRYVPDGLHPNAAGYRTFMVPTLLASLGLAEADVYDVVVYGGTSAGVIAAVQAKREGLTTVIVCPDTHLGGLSSGGLGWTDSGDKSVIGGLSRTFYQHVYEQYQLPGAWLFQTRDQYGNTGQGSPAMDGKNRTMWIFEPHVAETVFENMVKEHGIVVHRDQWLDRQSGVAMAKGRIQAITTHKGAAKGAAAQTFRGRMFIDATYEGDLLAAAGVSYTVGRESNATYGETLNGNQPGRKKHQFTKTVDPYVVPGDPSSGLLPKIQIGEEGVLGEGDNRVQAYNFRMCLTQVPENRVPFPKPDGYDPSNYELLLRAVQAHGGYVFNKFDPIPNRKTDTNNHGPFSTDNLGMNWDYPDASYARRQEIVAEHQNYQMGYFYFLANDPRVPDNIRERMARWGLAKDEFQDNGHWPHQIYVREARRMVGDFVVTENHLTLKTPTPRPVGMGSYNMDSHNVRRYVDPSGHVRNEGDVQVKLNAPYPIDYGAIVPKAGECDNLLVPVCVSASHIAFGSIRMEPVFMILGQSSSQAAALAIGSGVPVQDIDYNELRKRLVDAGQRLGDRPAIDLGPMAVDDTQAELQGSWETSRVVNSAVGGSYLHDGDANKGQTAARFVFNLDTPGRYDVQLAYTAHANRATNVPVSVIADGGRAKQVRVNEQKQPPIDGQYVSLGTLGLAGQVEVVVSNAGTNGHVTVDAVRLVLVGG